MYKYEQLEFTKSVQHFRLHHETWRYTLFIEWIQSRVHNALYMGRMQSAWGVFSVEKKAMAAALAEEDSSVKVWLARTCQVMNEAHCQTPLRPIIRRITVVLQTTRPSIHRAQLGRRAPPIFTSTESFSASAVISASPNLLIFNLDRTLVLSQGQSLITCSTLCPRDLSSLSAGNY